MKDKDTLTGWCTKYTTTQGVVKVTGNLVEVRGNHKYIKVTGNNLRGGFLKVGVDFFDDRAAAEENAQRKISNKVNSLGTPVGAAARTRQELEVGGVMGTKKLSDIPVSNVISYCRSLLADGRKVSSAQGTVVLLAAELDKLRDEKLQQPVATAPTPLRMRLRCEKCGELHIDKGEWATKPHKHHRCEKCGLVWQPALVHTVGVQFLDEEPAGYAASMFPSPGAVIAPDAKASVVRPVLKIKAPLFPSGFCTLVVCEKCGWPMYADSEDRGVHIHAAGECLGSVVQT